MHSRLLLAATLVAGLSSHALAQSQGVRSMLVDERGNAINATNPLPTSGGGGGGGGGTVTQGTSPWVISGTSAANGSGNPIFVQVTNPGTTGTVTAAGTNGFVAQAVQGITGGVPLPVSGTFWQATQPVSNAGTFAVQNTAAVVGGNATAVKTDGSAVTQPVSGTVSALNLGIYNSTAPTITSGAQTILQATANGSLFVDLSRGSPGGMFIGQYNSALPTLASGTAGYLAVDVNGRLVQSPGATVQLIAGSASIGSIGAGANLIGKVGSDVISSSGGLTNVSRIVSSAASTNATSAKSSAGRAYKITGYNAAASIRWLKFYNTASAPTPGTTTVFFQLPLPPGAFSFDAQDLGYYFGTGIAYAVTVGPADTDATAVTAADILNLNVWYQ